MVKSWISMKKLKITLFCAFLLLIFAHSGGALDFEAGSYGSLTEYLKELYGMDGNAGLTAFPVLNLPPGGAFAAVAKDVSFLEGNPAGSSLLPQTELAIFHHHWMGRANIEGAAFASRLGDLGFAAGGKWLYTPFTERNIHGREVSRGLYSEALAILNGSYNFLSGYYFSGLSLGVNLKGAVRFFPQFSRSMIAPPPEGSIITGAGWERAAAMAMADLGLLTRINLLKFYGSREGNLSLALVFRNLGPPVQGEPLPSAAAAGLAWKPLKPLLLSFDYSCPINLMNSASAEKPYWAAGLSVQALSFLSLRGSLLSRGETAQILLGGAVDIHKLSLDLDCALDLQPGSAPLNRISLGVRFNLGDQGRAAREAKTERLYLQGLEAYARGDLAAARQFWEAALQRAPRFEPAAEGLALIARSRALADRIEGMQSLD
jgi:hypothetical protein